MSLLRVNEAQRSEESLEYPVTNEIRRDFSLLSCPELVEGLKMTCLRKSCLTDFNRYWIVASGGSHQLSAYLVQFLSLTFLTQAE
jgi:hypothetical protein